MAGNNEKGKYDTPPEDVLKPLEPFEEVFNKAESASLQRSLRILEDQNGCLYINPDAQHIGSTRSSSDILRIYSREIQALRKIVSLLMGIIVPAQEIPSSKATTTPYLTDYNKVIEYLENASWELALVNDPLFPASRSSGPDHPVE